MAKKATKKRTGTGSAASKAPAKLTALVERNYSALRSIAEREIVARKLARSVTPTSLVAEAVMQLMKQRTLPRSTPQLCGLATILMTRALSDRSRRARTRKRGSARKPVALRDDIDRDGRTGARAVDAETLSLHGRLLGSLEKLSKKHPREMELITLRLVLELPMARVCELLSMPERTAYRELREGLELLKREMGWTDE
jgi:RNA polymerase sigma factor (sigma-70 family)